jgi:myo-inositol-1(or 4)-monophosphatase
VELLRAAGQRQADLEMSANERAALGASASEIEQVRAAVREAGRLALDYFRQEHGRWEKGPGQVVTDADIAVDRFLKGALLRDRPEDGWLSEETADDGSRLTRPRVWVVDPIDGTRSFAAGIAEFTICVGLLVGGRPVLGFVLNPVTGELFEAVRGQGARLDGAPIRVNQLSGLQGARIVVSKFENRRRNFARVLPGAEVETIGSLALKLCLVACGRYDGYLTWRRTQDWDIAAAALVLEEAGAVLSDPAGAPIRFDASEPVRRGLVAGSPGLHRAILGATRASFAALPA